MGCRIQDPGTRGKHQTEKKIPGVPAGALWCRIQDPGYWVPWLPVVEDSRLFAQRAHSTGTARAQHGHSARCAPIHEHELVISRAQWPESHTMYGILPTIQQVHNSNCTAHPPCPVLSVGTQWGIGTHAAKWHIKPPCKLRHDLNMMWKWFGELVPHRIWYESHAMQTSVINCLKRMDWNPYEQCDQIKHLHGRSHRTPGLAAIHQHPSAARSAVHKNNEAISEIYNKSCILLQG